MDAGTVEVICSLIAGVAAVLSAYSVNYARKIEQKDQRRYERRAKAEKLSIDLMYATCSLALVTAKKLTGHQTNGDVEESLERAADALGSYKDFARQEAANNIAKH